MDTNTFKEKHNFLQQGSVETIVPYTWNPLASGTQTLCQYFTVNHSENTKNLSLDLETASAFPSKIYVLEKVKNHNLQERFLKLLPMLLRNLQHTQS